MIVDLLNNLRKSPKSLKIFGKSLLYKIDLSTDIRVENESLEFLTQGSIRVGPLKSPGEFKTTYHVKNNEFEISSIKVDFPKVQFTESYIRKDGNLLFSNKKVKNVIVDESFGMTYDPQPLLFKMAMLDSVEDFQYSDRLLLSGKTRPYQFMCEGKILSMKMEGKELFRGLIRDSIGIEIPKFKIKVNVSLN